MEAQLTLRPQSELLAFLALVPVMGQSVHEGYIIRPGRLVNPLVR